LSDVWLFQWETPDIRQQTYKLLQQLMPFYQKLHAYLRIRLSDALPTRMPTDNTIPAHVLGNMWAQQWTHTMNTVKGVDPYPQIETIDVTDALKAQVYDQLICITILIISYY
jgi:peptidyl-dipeptidase A